MKYAYHFLHSKYPDGHNLTDIDFGIICGKIAMHISVVILELINNKTTCLSINMIFIFQINRKEKNMMRLSNKKT